MADVWVESEQSPLAIRIENVAWYGRRILETVGKGNASISVVLTDNAEIRKYNRDYLKRDKPTNVISFPMAEGEPIEGNATYLGDVILSVEKARQEAEKFGYHVGEMVLLYLIHGILHLVGYNHEGVSEQRAREMEKQQMDILKDLSPILKDQPILMEVDEGG